MSKQHRYAQYSTSDFDQFDCLKISKWIFVLVAFLLRAYIVLAMTTTNFNDRVGIIQWIYPEPILFYLSLLSGVVGLFVVLVLSLRRPNAADKVKACWRYIREIILLALSFDFIVNIVAYFYWQLITPLWLITQASLLILAVVILYTNKRIAINVEEFPEEMPEK